MISLFNTLENFWNQSEATTFAKIEQLFRLLSQSPPAPELLAYIAYKLRQHVPPYQAEDLISRLLPLDRYLADAFASGAFIRFSDLSRGKSVFFVSEHPSERELEMGEAAELAGWKPILVYERKPNYNPAKYFEASLEVPNPASILLLTTAISPVLCHVFTKGGGYTSLLHCRFKPASIVYDYYDTAAGLNLDWAIQNAAAERFCMASADAMTHRDLRAHHLRRDRGYRLPTHNIFIPDLVRKTGCSRKSSKFDGEIHVVSCGWVGTPGNPPDDSSIYRVARALTSKGVFVHVYPNPMQDSVDFRSTPLRAYKELEMESRFFKLHRPVGYDSFFDEMSCYDFGLSIGEKFILGEPLRDATVECLAGCGSSRVKTYLEMGMPIIISPELKYQFFVANRYGLAVPATRSFLENPRPVLEEALRKVQMTAKQPLSGISTCMAGRRLRKLYETLVCQQTEAKEKHPS